MYQLKQASVTLSMKLDHQRKFRKIIKISLIVINFENFGNPPPCNKQKLALHRFNYLSSQETIGNIRPRYVKGISGRRRRWNVENVVRSLTEAWREVPCDLIIASFQRTSFRTDDRFLKIRCNAPEDPETGTSFRKFDDYLSNVSRKQCESTGRSHSYNLRTRKAVRFDDPLNFATDSKGRDPTIDRAQVSGNLKGIYMGKEIDRKRRNLLKRSHDRAQLDEEAKSSDESTSRENEDIVIPKAARPPKAIDIQTIENLTRSSKSDDVRSTTRASMNEPRTDMQYEYKLDKTANKEGCKNGRELRNGRSPEADNANDGSIALQQVLDDTSAVDLEPNARVSSRAIPRDGTESADLNENIGCSPRKSLKRRSVDAEESQSKSDGEPERKRSRSDSDWMKQYETAFVFGPFDSARTLTTVSAGSDNGAQSIRPRCSYETERSIFTISPRRD